MFELPPARNLLFDHANQSGQLALLDQDAGANKTTGTRTQQRIHLGLAF